MNIDKKKVKTMKTDKKKAKFIDLGQLNKLKV